MLQIENNKSIIWSIVNEIIQVYSASQVSYFSINTGTLFMKTFYRDALEGLMLVIAIVGFISGEFVVSSILFASATVLNNIWFNRHALHTI